MEIGFNRPHLTGKEIYFAKEAVRRLHLSGNGYFTKKCQAFFQDRYGFTKCLLTHSCTAALEMAALLMDIKPGDEVIMPSYTFVSTANAFVLRGAKIIFCDSNASHPNIDHTLIEELITSRTKAIVVVHYAGVACEMDVIMEMAYRHRLFVVEDAAQAIDSFYKGRPLGSIGHFAAFSFHETKNISCGEGGMLVINDEKFTSRSEIIWEKGTNRAAFWRGEVDKYTWVDYGSSFLPSDILAALLYAQLEELESIQAKRISVWTNYWEQLRELQNIGVMLPFIPPYATNNAHLFYLVCRSSTEQQNLLSFLKSKGILALFHYLSLHKSPYYLRSNPSVDLMHVEKYSSCLIRLPFFYDLIPSAQEHICSTVKEFFLHD